MLQERACLVEQEWVKLHDETMAAMAGTHKEFNGSWKQLHNHVNQTGE